MKAMAHQHELIHFATQLSFLVSLKQGLNIKVNKEKTKQKHVRYISIYIYNEVSGIYRAVNENVCCLEQKKTF